MWIGDRSPEGAETWYLRWEQVAQSLGKWADTYGPAPESEDHAETIYQALFKTRRGRNYRALYVIHGSEVLILRIRGPNQDNLTPDEIADTDESGIVD